MYRDWFGRPRGDAWDDVFVCFVSLVWVGRYGALFEWVTVGMFGDIIGRERGFGCQWVGLIPVFV